MGLWVDLKRQDVNILFSEFEKQGGFRSDDSRVDDIPWMKGKEEFVEESAFLQHLDGAGIQLLPSAQVGSLILESPPNLDGESDQQSDQAELDDRFPG